VVGDGSSGAEFDTCGVAGPIARPIWCGSVFRFHLFQPSSPALAGVTKASCPLDASRWLFGC